MEELVEETALAGFEVDAPGEVRLENPEVGRFLDDFEAEAESSVGLKRELADGVPDGFFPVEDAAIAGGKGEQMLRTLSDEVPTEMAEAEEVGLGAGGLG